MGKKESRIEKLLDLHAPLIKRIAKSFYRKRGRRYMELEDCQQIATIGAIKAFGRLDSIDEKNIVPWIAICIRNELISGLRKYRGHRYSGDDAPQLVQLEGGYMDTEVDTDSLYVDNWCDVDTEIDAETIGGIIHDMVASGSFTELELAILNKCILGEQPAHEFASERGISQSWTSESKQRVIEKIKEMVATESQ